MPMAPAENADGLTADQHQALQTAHDEAASSGSPVTVDGLTTETSTTTADPSGTTTVNSTLLPTRAHKDGVWVPLDATLARNPDGTYSPTTAA
jgi:hypothetical protein